MWSYQNVDSDELYHYGVLGMRWGIRRGNVSKAYGKASKKADRLEKKAIKTNLKSAKLKAKAFKKERKATVDYGFDTGNKLVVSSEKTRKMHAKANKLALKSAKLAMKAYKWEGAMAKEFADVKVSDISEKSLNAGRRYASILMKG